MRVKKAVILAAGLGTRVLPASKAMPKEMLPIVDKPAIQFIVEEVVKSGIDDVLIITSRGKTTVEDHFDRSPELEQRLLASGKQDVYEEMVAISKLANIHYMRQKETKGTGHAVLGARTFVGDEPFVVLYGDDVILGDNPVCRQVCDLYDQYDLGVVGMKEVPTELVMKYCTLDVTTIQDKIFKVTDMIEKPSREQIISHYSILGRCVLPPKIFPILENTQPGAGGEIQLTDAMCELAHQEGMIGLDFDGTRYDMGNKLGILEAIVQVGLSHKDIGQQFREYLKQVAKEL